MTEWERTNIKSTTTRWMCVSSLGDMFDHTPFLRGFSLEGDDSEALIVLTTDEHAEIGDILFDGTFQIREGDHIFGGPIIDGRFTEYASIDEAQPFTFPHESTHIKLPTPTKARMCWLIHRSTTGQSYTLREFTPHQWFESEVVEPFMHLSKPHR